MKRTVTVEKFGDSYRLLYMSKKRSVEEFVEKLEEEHDGSFNGEDEDADNTSEHETESLRLSNNIARARSRVRELALCNDWEYFFTGTIDERKEDRFNLNNYISALGNWFGNLGKKYNTHIRYIIIPEEHRHGGWHVHGLLCGFPQQEVQSNAYGYLHCPAYSRRFGFCSLSPVKSHRRVASYITKYITKDFASNARKKGEHLFYASQHLKGKEKLWSFDVPSACVADYEGEYVGITWADKSLREILDKFILAQQSGDRAALAACVLAVEEQVYNKTDNWTDDKLLAAISASSDLNTPS